jgi:hypothetical protein
MQPTKGIRSWQGSNLRGQSPLDFKSNALTTRPQLHSFPFNSICRCKRVVENMEMRGIEPRAFHMQSERSTTELHPRRLNQPLTPRQSTHRSSLSEEQSGDNNIKFNMFFTQLR